MTDPSPSQTPSQTPSQAPSQAPSQVQDAPRVEICRWHRDRDHGHCSRCGVAVFKDLYDEQQIEWEDHTCPPGFLDTSPDDPGRDGRG